MKDQRGKVRNDRAGPVDLGSIRRKVAKKSGQWRSRQLYDRVDAVKGWWNEGGGYYVGDLK